MLIAGLGFPIPFYLLHKKFPKFGFNFVFTPILVGKLRLLVHVQISILTFHRIRARIPFRWY